MRTAAWSAGLAVLALISATACTPAREGARADAASGTSSLAPAARQRLTSPAPSPDRQDRQDYYRQKNEIMARCMKDAGFEYRSFTPPPTARESMGLSDEEFRKQYGFGISTLIDRQPAPQRRADPNARAAAELGGSRQEAYLRAATGCEEQVFRRLGPPAGGGPVSGPVDDPLQNLVADAAAKAEADPRIATAKRRYQACMAGRGFRAASGEGITGQISDRAAPFVQAYQARVDQVRASGRDPARVKLADVLDPAQRAALAKLQRYELEAAAADAACGSLLYPIVDQVHREYLDRALDGG